MSTVFASDKLDRARINLRHCIRRCEHQAKHGRNPWNRERARWKLEAYRRALRYLEG